MPPSVGRRWRPATARSHSVAECDSPRSGTRGHPATIGDLVDVLDTTRHQLETAAERIRRLPERITATVRQLADTQGANQPDPTVETVTGQWSRATEQLTLVAASLSTAVAALSSYTGALSGADTPTA